MFKFVKAKDFSGKYYTFVSEIALFPDNKRNPLVLMMRHFHFELLYNFFADLKMRTRHDIDDPDYENSQENCLARFSIIFATAFFVISMNVFSK